MKEITVKVEVKRTVDSKGRQKHTLYINDKRIESWNKNENVSAEYLKCIRIILNLNKINEKQLQKYLIENFLVEDKENKDD